MNSPRIFARARTEPPLLAKPPAISDIVAAVRRPAALQVARAALDTLHARRGTTHAALLGSIRDQPDLDRQSTGSPSTRHIEKLGRELADIDKQIQAATLEWETARAPFTAAVASALAPTRRSAVDAAIAGVNELVAALRVIDGINLEITRAGGTAMRFPPLYRNAVGALRARLQQLARMSEPALSRLRVLAECLARCRLPATRLVEILYAAIRAEPSPSCPLGGLYQALPEVREMAAELALCGFSTDEVEMLIDAMLETGIAAARAKREGRIALLRGAATPELPN